MLFKSNLKFIIIIYFSFIIFTVIGTLSHEFGHFVVGRYLGYQSTIHYSSTKWGDSELDKKIHSIYESNKAAIDSNTIFVQKQEFEALIKKSRNNRFWMIVGGPFQTMLTGTIGCVVIFILRRKRKYATKVSDWIYLFLTLFWLRQPTNLFTFYLGKIAGKVSNRGDEIRLAYYLNLPKESIALGTGIIGFLISAYVILKFVPKNKLIPFCLSGFLGGVSGYILWLKKLGPIVLP